MKTKVLVVLIFSVLLFFIFKMDSNNSNHILLSQNEINSGILAYKTFDCEGFEFSFQFPDFKDWEMKGIEKKENHCIIYFNWPNNIEYEVSPQIIVEKINLGNQPDKTKQNPQGIYYEYLQDSSLYVENHKFEEGDWDWLVFYGKDFDVKISKNGFGEPSFDEKLFYQKIIETFSF